MSMTSGSIADAGHVAGAGVPAPTAANGLPPVPAAQGEPPESGEGSAPGVAGGRRADVTSLVNDPSLIQPIVEQVVERAKLLKEWYDRKASERGRQSRKLRIASVVLVVLGGLCPLLPESMGAEFMQPYGYLLLAVAAGFVVLDRAFGVSTSWMRYRMAHMRIDREQSLFQLSVDTTLAQMNSPNSDREALAQDVLDSTRAFLTKIEDFVVEETEAWLQEFATEHSKFSQKYGGGDDASGR